jgi:predicted amidohydrolase
MRVEPGEVRRNLTHAAKRVGDAAALGAQVALLPEALPFGWMDPSARTEAGKIPDGKHFQEFAAVAAHHRIYLCTGLVEKTASGTVFNSAVLIGPDGELLLHHRKIHELGIAHGCYALGDRLGVANTEFGRIGLMICADGFAPAQVLTRSLALMGARLILSPCAWAVPPTHDNTATPYGKLWLDNYGPVAREFGIWVAGCSNVGPVKIGPWAGHKCIGCSLVVGPNGSPEARGGYGENADEIIFVDVALKPIVRTSGE